jgi:hypothetical protein
MKIKQLATPPHIHPSIVSIAINGQIYLNHSYLVNGASLSRTQIFSTFYASITPVDT